MFAIGTKKQDKNLVNSVMSMDEIFGKANNFNLKNSNLSGFGNKSMINLNNNPDWITIPNNIQKNSEIDNFGFENIELPKEQDFGEFRVISTNTSEMNSSTTIKKKDLNKVDLINLLIINKAYKQKNNIPSIKSYITSIYYNKNTTKYKFDKNTFESPCYIFDENIEKISINSDINFSKNFFLYMSYRSGFETLKNVGSGDYTSDCGWGCMLRCCQMMLSRGIIKRELYKMNKIDNSNKDITDLDLDIDILNLKKDMLCLFSDKFIPFELLKNNRFLSELYKKYCANEKNYEMIPPYSIYTLCKLSRSSGVYTSDLKIIKCFIEINEQLFSNYFRIVHFENGEIKRKTIFETFCKKKDLLSMENIDNPLVKVNLFDYFGEEYYFSKPGLVFISLRLGLRDLDEYYFDIIHLFFEKIHNNIGFVSGKKNKAFYFIGFNGNNQLIYADPHLNQKAEDNDISSYEVKDLFLLNIKELSSGITIGISINSSTDLKIMVNELEWFYKKYPTVMTFK